MPVFLRVMNNTYILNVSQIKYINARSNDEWVVFFAGNDYIVLDLLQDIDALNQIINAR